MKIITLPSLPALPTITLPSLKTMIFTAFFVQSFFGLMLMIFSSFYSVTDKPKAQEMIEFIHKENPDYYKLLVSSEDKSYIEEFYENYQIKGNRGLYFIGILFIMTSMNLSIPILFITVKDFLLKKNEPLPELEGSEMTGEGDQGAEEKKTSDDTTLDF